MRLDLFLKASRLCPRRTVAQELCDAGFVFVNGAPAKSARIVRVGDEITLHHRGGALLTVRVRNVPAERQTTRRDAATLYEVVNGCG
jgi:ribosomal 50S subunit-recycling heat shock protein